MFEFLFCVVVTILALGVLMDFVEYYFPMKPAEKIPTKMEQENIQLREENELLKSRASYR